VSQIVLVGVSAWAALYCQSAVGLCTLNSFDPYPIIYSLSNP
jgi:hypothetical protein